MDFDGETREFECRCSQQGAIDYPFTVMITVRKDPVMRKDMLVKHSFNGDDAC